MRYNFAARPTLRLCFLHDLQHGNKRRRDADIIRLGSIHYCNSEKLIDLALTEDAKRLLLYHDVHATKRVVITIS